MHKYLTRISLSLIAGISFYGCSTIGLNNNNNWMDINSSQLQNKNLSDIRIPGSHYANAYGIKNAATPICQGEINNIPPTRSAAIAKLVQKDNKITLDQLADYYNLENKDVYDQLNSGIRYLDIQICLQNNTFYTSNYFLTEQLDSILNQVKTFISENPKEVLIIDFDHRIWDEHGAISKQNIPALHQLIADKFGKLLIKKTAVSELTFNKIWKGYGRVLIMSSNNDLNSYDDIWNKDKLITVSSEATWTTIKKLTNIQLTLNKIESTNTDGMTIIPIYSSFNPQKNTTQEIGNNFNNYLVMDYLYSLPDSTPINIIVGDNEYLDALVRFSTYMYQSNK